MARGNPFAETVAVFERGELEAKIYRGMNPAFVRKVWAKRRATRPPIDLSSQRAAKLAAQIEVGGAKAIIAQVALKHGMTVEDLTGSSRKRVHIKARGEALKTLAATMPHLTLGQLGMMFGGRGHSTICWILGRKKSSQKPAHKGEN